MDRLSSAVWAIIGVWVLDTMVPFCFRKFMQAGIRCRSEGTFGLSRPKWTLSNTMLMTCEIPCPRSQEDVAGVAPTAEVVAPVRAGMTSAPAIRPVPATPEKRRRLVACVR